MKKNFNEHDVVYVRGTIVHVYPGKEAYCVEINNETVTLLSKDIIKLDEYSKKSSGGTKKSKTKKVRRKV